MYGILKLTFCEKRREYASTRKSGKKYPFLSKGHPYPTSDILGATLDGIFPSEMHIICL
jgi:hypothetical protein